MNFTKFTKEIYHPFNNEYLFTISIDPFSVERSIYESELLGVDLNDIHNNVLANAMLCASIVKQWDDDFFGCECTFDNALNIFSDVNNIWIVKQIAECITKYDNEYQIALDECLEYIEQMWDSNEKIGKETKSTLYKKLERDYHKLPDNFKQQFDRMKEENKHILENNFKPDNIILKAFNTFFQIRKTLTLDAYISYTHIDAFIRTTHKSINPYDIEAILKMDRTFVDQYYKQQNKNNSQ